MAWFFFPRVLSAGMMIFTLMVLTRALGAEDFGRYNLAVTAATIGYSVLVAWISAAMHRFHTTPEFGGRASGMLLGAFGLTLLVSVPVALGIALAVPGDWRTLSVLIVAYYTGHALFEIGLSVLRVLGMGPAFAATVLLRPMAGIGLVVLLLVYVREDYVSAVSGMAAMAFALGLASVLWGAARGIGVALPPRDFLRAFLAFGLPLALVGSAGMVIALVAQGALVTYADFASVGVYAAAHTLAMRTINMPMVMMERSVSVNVFHAYDRAGAEAANSALSPFLGYLLLVSVPVTVVLVGASGTVSTILFGQEVGPAAAVHLPYLAAAAFLSGLQGAFFSFGFTISRRTGVQGAILIATVALHAVLTFFLVYGFGPIGASWAFLAASLFSLSAFVVLGARFHRIEVGWSHLRRIVPAVIVLVPPVLLADRQEDLLQAVALLLLGGAAFAAVLYATGYAEMRRLVARMTRRRA